MQLQPKSNKAIADEIINDTQADGFCVQRRAQILKALAQKDAEVAEEVSEWATHNAKTIHHNNGHREYVDVRDLLDFLSTPKE